MVQQYIAIFNSARKVILADDLCHDQGLKTTVIHVPKQYSSECGMCLKLEEANLPEFKELMNQELLNYQLYKI